MKILIVALPEEFKLPVPDDWQIVYSGVGKVNAAIKTTEILKDLSPSETIVINFGSAGSSDYKIGELIKCLQFQQGDIDTIGGKKNKTRRKLKKRKRSIKRKVKY